MNCDESFTIVYQKLAEALPDPSDGRVPARAEASASEIDEIDHLRRMVLEVTDPEPMSYTMA